MLLPVSEFAKRLELSNRGKQLDFTIIIDLLAMPIPPKYSLLLKTLGQRRDTDNNHASGGIERIS